MTVKVVIDLIDKLSQKKGKAERSAKDLKRSMDRLKGDNSSLASGEDRLARSAQKVAGAQKAKAGAMDAAGRAARRHKSDLQQLERQEERLAQKARKAQAAQHGGRGRGANAVGGWETARDFGAGAVGGAGAGMMIGGATAVGTMIGSAMGAAILGGARDEFAKDQLQVLAGMTDAQFAQYDAYLKSVGAKRGVGTQGAYGVFGEMMMGGMDAAAAREMADPIIIFAKATQAAEEDAARTAMALANNLKIVPAQMMEAFDAMATGAKEGQFEVRDMAKSFPSLAAKMAAVGGTGLDAMKNIVSMAEIVRSVSGTSDEAATNLENFFDKLTATDFVDNAKDLGINVEKSFERANKNGLNPALELVKEIKTKIGNNAFKLGELVPDRQARVALLALINQLDEWEAKNKRAGNSAGTVMKDYETATNNASTAWDRFSANIANKAKSQIAPAIPLLTDAMNALSDAMEGGSLEKKTRTKFFKDKGEEGKIRKAYGDHVTKWMDSTGRSTGARQRIKTGYEQYGASRQAGAKADNRLDRAKKLKKILGPNIEDMSGGNQDRKTAEEAGIADGRAYVTGFQKGVDGANVPIPTPRPDRSKIPVPTPRPANPSAAIESKINGSGPKLSEADASAQLSKIFQGFVKGGDAAADRVSSGAADAGTKLGSAASDRITGGAAAAGDAFGRAAAAQIAAAAANIRVQVAQPAASKPSAPLPRAATGALHGGME